MEAVKIIRITSFDEQQNDVAYWRTRPASERWDAMLRLREQAWKLYCLGQKIPYINDRPFQTIYKIIKRA